MTTAMTTGTQARKDHPRDTRTGLTLPLRTSLGSQDLARHRAMVALELEVMAKKFDRFGWDRDMGSPVHDRLITDWMDALCDFPLEEVKAACRAWVEANPRRMPNEGDIKALVMKGRARIVASLPKPSAPEPERKRIDPETAARILAEAGFEPKRMTGE